MTRPLQKLRNAVAHARRVIAGHVRHLADLIDAPNGQGVVS